MDNKKIAFNYLKSYEKGDQQVLDSYLHTEHIYYAPGGYEPSTREERIDEESFFFSAFKDIKVTIEDQILEGDKVVNRIIMNCLHSGMYQGIAPTNRRIIITYINILIIKDRKIYKEWAEFNMHSILNQLQ